MSSETAQVKIAGRFPAGEVVALVEVAGPHVLRAGEGKTLTRKRVDEDGVVVFDEGVKLDGRYFVTGLDNGRPVEVRATGAHPDAASELKQAPITTEPRKFANGDPIPVIASNADPDKEVGAPVEPKAKPARKRPSRARKPKAKPARKRPSRARKPAATRKPAAAAKK